MDELLELAVEVEEYLQELQRLEAEKQQVLKQLMLELELAQVLASQHPVT